MPIGFRKSFLGFNCTDVMQYIESTHKNYVAQETVLQEKADELSVALSELQRSYDTLAAENEKINAQLKEYTDQYDEIGRLSENIGKLYLVAQANAQAIMNNATENAELAKEEVRNNISSIAEAHQSLDSIRGELLSTTGAFAEKVGELMDSLDATRGKIETHNGDSTKQQDDFDSVWKMLVK